ncbi:hypothetical protein CWC06_17060 [Pseudoalteromonas ruthenica]|nr:hypothetical protein CWC06_17060 [Pseudoalteromonas ruthenica]
MVELSRVKNARKKHCFFSFEREVRIPSRGDELGCQTIKVIKKKGNGGAKQGEKRSKKASLF